MSNIKIQSFDGTNYTQQNPYSYFAENADKLDNYHANDFVLNSIYKAGIFSVKKVFEKSYSYTYASSSVLKETISFPSPEKIVFLVEQNIVNSITVVGRYTNHSGTITAGILSNIYASVSGKDATYSISNQSSFLISPRMGH